MTLTLRQARRLKEKSQEEMAKEMGVHVNTYRRWEEKPDNITVGLAKKISHVLGIPCNEIFFAK
jgi:DNA-binding XRE family transcriptional regulator